MNIKSIFTALLVFVAPFASAVTTVILEDGTVIETNDKVYISDEQLYKFEEASAVSAESSTDVLVEPEEQGSPEWCEWYVAINGGTVAPSFDPNYSIYVRNCRD